jgi:hypothetical protein
MRHMAAVTFGLLVAALAAHAGQVYKCKIDGKVIFADKPCAADQVEQIELRYSRFNETEAAAANNRYTQAKEQEAAILAQQRKTTSLEHQGHAAIAQPKAKEGSSRQQPPRRALGSEHVD